MAKKPPPWLDPDILRQAAEAARLAAQFGPMIHEVMQRGALEVQQRALEALGSIPQDVREIMGRVQGAVTEALRYAPDLHEALRRWNDWIEHLPPALRDALTMLGQNGWYPDEEMSLEDILVFAQRFKGGADINEANEALCCYFEEHADNILASLVARYPKRERFFRSAFAAHRRGDYEASVPLLLAQADGISQDQLQVQLYGRNRGDGSLKTAAHAEQYDDLDKAMRLPFLVPLPIL